MGEKGNDDPGMLAALQRARRSWPARRSRCTRSTKRLESPRSTWTSLPATPNLPTILHRAALQRPTDRTTGWDAGPDAGPRSRAAVFAELIGGDGHPEPTLLGVEQEFSLFDADGRQVDARSLLVDLGIPGALLDPGDPFARRLPWGGVLTADGPEAEIATPPVALGPGAFGRVVDLADLGREQLTAALPSGVVASGYSTHLSVAVGDRLTGAAAALYATTFACGLMLLTERQDSPGLLVRPRPGRLELCTEFIDGEQLREALAFAAGSALAVARAVATGDRSIADPGARPGLAPAVDRFGWYVDRHAFGVDLHEAWGATGPTSSTAGA